MTDENRMSRAQSHFNFNKLLLETDEWIGESNEWFVEISDIELFGAAVDLLLEEPSLRQQVSSHSSSSQTSESSSACAPGLLHNES